MGTIIKNGIVIFEKNKYDSGKTITVLLKDHGKINAYVRGAKKINASTQIFSYGKFFIQQQIDNINQQKKFNLIKQIDLIENISPKSYINICYAMYFCELVNKYLLTNISCNDILILLLKSLKALQTDFEAKYIARIFEFKFMKLNGLAPYINSCHNCGLIRSQMYFDGFGLICSDCVDYSKKVTKISQDTIDFMSDILEKNFDELIFKIPAHENMKKITELSRIFIENNLELYLNTRKFICEIENKQKI